MVAAAFRFLQVTGGCRTRPCENACAILVSGARMLPSRQRIAFRNHREPTQPAIGGSNSAVLKIVCTKAGSFARLVG